MNRAEVENAARDLLAQVLEDVAADGRPVVGLGLKVRYAPFITRTFTRKIASTFDRDVVVAKAMELIEKIEPDRPVRLLGLRAEMAMPEDARKDHSRRAAAGEPSARARTHLHPAQHDVASGFDQRIGDTAAARSRRHRAP